MYFLKINIKWPSIGRVPCSINNDILKACQWSMNIGCFWNILIIINGSSAKVTCALLASETIEKLSELSAKLFSTLLD